MFHGLGGAKRVAERRWSFPAGIQHNHFITSLAEIEGSMVGLISRFELAKLGYTWHAMEDACSFSRLGVDWLPFAKTSSSLLLDIFEFDNEPCKDNLFSKLVSPISSAHVSVRKGNASNGVDCEGNASQAASSEEAYAMTRMFECLRENDSQAMALESSRERMPHYPRASGRRW